MLARHAGFVYERVFFIDPLPCGLFVRHWWIIDDHRWSLMIVVYSGYSSCCRPWISMGISHGISTCWVRCPNHEPWFGHDLLGNRRSITECPHANYMVIFGYIPYGRLWPIEMIESHLPRTWWCSAMSNYQRLCNLIKTAGYLQFSNITMQNPRFWYPLVNIQKAIENHYV